MKILSVQTGCCRSSKDEWSSNRRSAFATISQRTVSYEGPHDTVRKSVGCYCSLSVDSVYNVHCSFVTVGGFTA